MPGESTRFKPGQSGNPGGRPKKKHVTEALLAAIGDDPVLLAKAARALLKRMAKGDTNAAVFVRDTVDGKPAQTVQVSGTEGSAILVALNDRRKRLDDDNG